MDRLPKFLIKAIECACEEYGIITYSFHGDNDKTRISIMFSNTDSNKQVKRKSGSARRRDNKRLKEFNDIKSNSEVVKVDDTESIDIDNMNIDECTVDKCEERTIDTDISLLGASSFTHSIPIEHVDEKRCTFNKQVTVDIPVKQVINSDRNLPVGETIECNEKRKQIVKRKHSKENEIKQQSSIVCGKDSLESKHEEFEKIVCKRSRTSGDVLIGKIIDINLIVTCNVTRKSIEAVDKRDARYDHYLRLLFKEFDDITETDFHTDKAKEAIELMINYVKSNKMSAL
ncbi:unnamed protein product [Mytilus coruscus]|uniref:Uncharacterized protein n=1 Tax=Mytilus coruscus TaxID=42192 RepID=A0A6J8EVF7_MYTCO|nr:unnamed protein product [Mytilus coruscus]